MRPCNIFLPLLSTRPLASLIATTLAAVLLSLSIDPTVQAAEAAHFARPVLQRGYDPGVSGATLTETTLNTSNVGPNGFGLVFTLPVDDAVYAQPLYVPNVASRERQARNILYVATMSDSLYAFDADFGGAPLWHINLATLVNATPVAIEKFELSGNFSITGNVGILSTPVIDPSTNVMYVVACTLENGTMAYRLHAIDIVSGSEPYGAGVLISANYAGSTFDARYETQRVSLALSGNQVVFAFGALEQEFAGNYVGWVMAYNKRTLLQDGAFATVTTGNRGGGVWQSGRPPAVDSAGNVYLFVGNAYGSGYDGAHNFSESVLKLDPSHGLQLLDWFTPGNWATLDSHDLDLTSSGPFLIPGTKLLAGGGKAGEFYVLNTANLGKYNATDSQVVQEEDITAGGAFRGGPVFWQRSAANGGPLLYNWAVGDAVKAFPFSGTKLAANPSAEGSADSIFPGGMLAMSADGERHGSGILWATSRSLTVPSLGTLHAFDAEDVANELWNSTMNATRDGYGKYAYFVPPLIANGKVYVPTFSNQVAVYGLLRTRWFAPNTPQPTIVQGALKPGGD
jgi:hypothetical protein